MGSFGQTSLTQKISCKCTFNLGKFPTDLQVGGFIHGVCNCRGFGVGQGQTSHRSKCGLVGDSVTEWCVAPCFSKLTSLWIFFEENPLGIIASSCQGAKFLRGKWGEERM
jgi:hypothetical protein